MKRALSLVVVIAVLLSLSGCVDYNYDLNKLDKTITVVPGLAVPVKTDAASTNLYDSFFKNASQGLSVDDEGTMTIGNSCGGNVTSIELTSKDISEIRSISLPGTVSIECSLLLSDLIPGAVISVDASPVCEVENPLNHSLNFSGVAKCGEKTVAFGPYEVPSGKSKVALKEKEILEMLHPVKNDIVLSDMVLEGVLEEDVAPQTKASGNYVFDITGYIPMEFSEGESLCVSVPLDDISEKDIQSFAEENGIDVKSFVLNLDVTNNAPFELTASATATTSGKKATATMSPSVEAGSIETPTTTRTTVTVTLPQGVTDLTEVNLYVVAKAKEAKSALKTDHAIIIQTIDVTFNKGIQLEL